MQKCKIALIGGARPNFMKLFPLCRELKKQKINFILINTGQHSDKKMSEDFFNEFGLKPDYNIKPSPVSGIRQISDIMNALEEIFVKETINLVVVVGDVNSTLAGALVANKLNIKLVHIEAGLRSFNNSMPEEYNRKLTDHLADYLFTTMEEALDNLSGEGINKNIYFVGNIMIDTLAHFDKQAKKTGEEFYFCTLHRAENVDDRRTFGDILDALEEISRDEKIYFPLHPRTAKMAKKFGFLRKINKIFSVLPPLSYADSVYYQKNALLVLTDSGGVQEETSFLGVPCLTLRTETERPITIEKGTNILAGVGKKAILAAYKKIDFKNKKKTVIPLWDGKTAERIVKIIKNEICAE